MIVGKKIIDDGLISGGSVNNLKHSTYDLSVGEIIPIGKEAVKARLKETPATYFLEPREMVWILSKEEFALPSNITGLATLRTTYTKNGILALNVGIIDPFFRGPISTALINADFSKSFMNIPSFDDKFYQEKFWNIIFYGITKNKAIAIPLSVLVFILGWFLIELGFIDFLLGKWTWITEHIQKLKFW